MTRRTRVVWLALILSLAILVGLPGVGLAAWKTLEGGQYDVSWGGGYINLEFHSKVEYGAGTADIGVGFPDCYVASWGEDVASQIRKWSKWYVTDMDPYWIVPNSSGWSTDGWNAYLDVQTEGLWAGSWSYYGPDELIVSWQDLPSTVLYQETKAYWGGAGSPQLQASNSAYLG